MACYTINYDLSKPGQDYADLYKRIKAYGTWAHVVESMWIIVTTKTATAVCNDLKQAIDSNDKLFVGSVRSPASWVGMDDEMTKWLQKLGNTPRACSINTPTS